MILRGQAFEKWDETNAYFSFEDSTYNSLKGEISGFGPEALKKMSADVEAGDESKFKSVYFKTKAWDNYFVRYYVPNSLRDEVENKLGYKLPDEFCEKKYTNLLIKTIGGAVNLNGLSDKAKEIIQKPIQSFY